MGRPSNWPKGTEIERISLGLPAKLLEEAKVRATRERRTLQELVAEALAAFLKKKGGRP